MNINSLHKSLEALVTVSKTKTITETALAQKALEKVSQTRLEAEIKLYATVGRYIRAAHTERVSEANIFIYIATLLGIDGKSIILQMAKTTCLVEAIRADKSRIATARQFEFVKELGKLMAGQNLSMDYSTQDFVFGYKQFMSGVKPEEILSTIANFQKSNNEEI